MQVAIFPCTSATLYFIAFVPLLKILFDALPISFKKEVEPVLEKVKFAALQLSEVSGSRFDKDTVQLLAPVFAVTFAGQVILGFIVSRTKTENGQVATLLSKSLTLYMTVFRPALRFILSKTPVPEAKVAPEIT